MTSESEDRPGRKQIEVDALFAAQQAERRRQRLRVAAVTVATLTAGGLIGGLAVGAIDGGDGGQPTADDAGTSEGSARGSSPEPSGSPGESESEETEDSLPGADATGPPLEVPSSAPSEDSGTGGFGTGSSTTGGSGGTGGPQSSPPGPPSGTSDSAPSDPAAQPTHHVVRSGDSLWTITAQLLGEQATAEQVLDAWPRLYAANRDGIGADPDLIHPGQELVLPRLS